MTTRDQSGGQDTLTWAGGSSAPAFDGLPPRWRLERPLGRGGQAEVWLARDTGGTTGRHPTSQGQLERAAALAKQAHTELYRLGREELIYHLWAPLADHVAAKALAAQGRHGEAADLYARAAAAAPNCWFGQPPATKR